MKTGSGPKLTVSQGFEVLEPRSGPAYPVPCSEWDYLRDRLKKVEHAPWFFQAAGFMLLGATASTFIALLVGAVPDEDRAHVIAWAATTVCTILGGAFLWLHHRELGVHRQAVADVLRQMELIESRYDRRKET